MYCISIKKYEKKRFDLDMGCAVWGEFTSTLFFRRIPSNSAQQIKRNFFSRLLAANQLLFQELRTKKGKSIGYLNYLAGYFKRALRSLEKEIKFADNDPKVRLCMANCHFAQGNVLGARLNYREGLLKKLPPTSYREIEDTKVRTYLKNRSDDKWAVVEACIDKLLPVAPFQSAGEFREFLSKQPSIDSPLASDVQTEEPVRHFYCCLVISENKRFAENDLLVRSRKLMKSLHPELHRVYMEKLEQMGR
ncbi:MAG: hypothetical protein ACE5MK_01720 [Acidobacteriota bacterium]